MQKTEDQGQWSKSLLNKQAFVELSLVCSLLCRLGDERRCLKLGDSRCFWPNGQKPLLSVPVSEPPQRRGGAAADGCDC